MDLLSLFSLQGTLFAMILIGAWLKKRGVIDEDGKRCLTDLCIQIVIPCNTFKSCLIQFDMGIFQSCALLLLDYLEHGMDAEPFLRTYDLINIRTVQP